nr:tyrosine-type recombinase/integrase [Pseudomonas sp. GM74]
MDLAYRTGQRVTDTRLLDERDVRDDQIRVLQGKTNAKRRIEITGELKVLIDRIMSRKKEHRVRSTRLIVSETGTPMTVAIGHTTVVMTEQYIRNRIGKKVSPTK